MAEHDTERSAEANRDSNQTRLAAAKGPSLVATDPLVPWLIGHCAIPRLRGLRFGNASCPLPPRMRPYPAGDHLHGWAQSAYLFSTRGDWNSWRGRRTVVRAQTFCPACVAIALLALLTISRLFLHARNSSPVPLRHCWLSRRTRSTVRRGVLELERPLAQQLLKSRILSCACARSQSMD